MNVRTTFLGATAKPEFPKRPRQNKRPQPVAACRAWFDRKAVKTAVFDRELLAPGVKLAGPAIIGEYSSTTVIPPGFRCTVDGYSNLVVEQQ